MARKRAPKPWEWFLNESETCLVINAEHGSEHFYVALDELTDSKQVLWWVSEISHKTWATPEVLADFVRKLDLVLELQENYCRKSVETVDPIKTAKAVKSFWTSAANTLAKHGHLGKLGKGGSTFPQLMAHAAMIRRRDVYRTR